MRMVGTEACVVAAFLSLSGAALAGDNAVIIQAWMPTEADGLDWAPQDEDTLDELWNDCVLVYQEFLRRPGIDGDTDRVHMFWGLGSDYSRQGARYSPERLRVRELTDDSASVITVDSLFQNLGSQMGSSDTLFCYTWGHGSEDGWHHAIQVREIKYEQGALRGTPLWDTALARMTSVIQGPRVFICSSATAAASWTI